jgi:restriction system protein
MKWNLKQNSLFAILLRAPWWYSFGIAAALSLIASALLPSNLKLGGALGSFPFVVIGVMAWRRQAKEPSAADVTRTVEQLNTLDWTRLSPLLEQALALQGYTVSRCLHNQADFELTKDGSKALLLARRFKSAQTGTEPLVALRRAADEAEAGQAIVVSIGALSEKAQRFANTNRIQVWGAKDLAALKMLKR